MSEKLLPCPFCGSKDCNSYWEDSGSSAHRDLWFVSCGDCGASVGSHPSESFATEEWNKRQPTSAREIGKKERKRISEIRERVDKAAPAPWRNEPSDRCTHGTYRDVTYGREEFEDECDCYSVADYMGFNEAEFIAHSRTDIPYLLDLVEGLRTRVSELEDRLQKNQDERLRVRWS